MAAAFTKPACKLILLPKSDLGPLEHTVILPAYLCSVEMDLRASHTGAGALLLSSTTSPNSQLFYCCFEIQSSSVALDWCGTHRVAQVGPELILLLLSPPKHWGDRRVPPGQPLVVILFLIIVKELL